MAFVPRNVFPTLDFLPRSYFLGHHRAGLNKMKTMLSAIDLVLECRDYRVPLTSRNPLFEESLAGRDRLIIYTKQDLGSGKKDADKKREKIIEKWHHPSSVMFSDFRDQRSVRKVLEFARQHTFLADRLTGARMMIVGMPNVGKSSLLNSLRRVGVDKGKAAQTGAQPGITRKISTSVKIIDGKDESEGVYLLDTPGVFIPYVPDAEAMLKLALCGNVKDTIIAPTILADYLLYTMNMLDPSIYAEYSGPTNDINELLDKIAAKIGRLGKGGVLDTEAAALWYIQRWRGGQMGRFVLDTVAEDSLDLDKARMENMAPSLSQARRTMKETQRQRSKRQLAA